MFLNLSCFKLILVILFWGAFCPRACAFVFHYYSFFFCARFFLFLTGAFKFCFCGHFVCFAVMDLKQALEDCEWMRKFLCSASKQLHALNDVPVYHGLYCDKGTFVANVKADSVQVLKPVSITEFCRTSSTLSDNHCAVVGACFDNWEACSQWELQYMVFFFLFVSPSLVSFFRDGSPRAVWFEYLSVFTYTFEAHVSGASVPCVSKGRGDSILTVPTTSLEFTIRQMLKIYSIYNFVQ